MINAVGQQRSTADVMAAADDNEPAADVAGLRDRYTARAVAVWPGDGVATGAHDSGVVVADAVVDHRRPPVLSHPCVVRRQLERWAWIDGHGSPPHSSRQDHRALAQ